MKKIQEISDYRVLGYSEKDKDELSDRETEFSAKPKKLGFNNILKLGAKLTPFKIPDNDETDKMIEDRIVYLRRNIAKNIKTFQKCQIQLLQVRVRV